MKAIVITKYGPPEVLELRQVDKPTPKDNEVLIRIHATAVVATDPMFRKGDPFIGRFFTGLTKPKHAIPGDVVAGDIEAVGKAVTFYKPGDQVYAACAMTQGGQAEYICLPEDGPLAIMPVDMSYEEAAGVPDGALGALNFLRDAAGIQSGQTILINGGSGSVGTYAVQLAVDFGTQVTAVCSTPNVDLVKSLGAHKVIDYTKEDFTQNGQTYDIIFDAVGKSSFSRCKNSLKQNGVYVTTVPALDFMLGVLLTSKSKGKRAAFVAPGLRSSSDKAKDLNFLKELIEAGKIRSVIDRRYPLEEIVEAHKYVEAGHKKGNVVITVARNITTQPGNI
ncbi:MAG: NAD(P)-dependent alcohol dehydrogenase [Anaerolineales bacterium]|nr:NAD(P)-dependent alcohol dehydrogenase [Anaerolineales bacterium]